MTTTENLSSHCDSIPLDKLPRTILDAVKTTRALSLQYLWIDSFCILQDSTEDKKTQLHFMGSIYHSAYVTYAASAAESVEEGFLDKPPRMRYSIIQAMEINSISQKYHTTLVFILKP